MEKIVNVVRNYERTEYFASLHSPHFYNWVVRVHDNTPWTIKKLKEEPESVRLLVAQMDPDYRNGQWCSLILCSSQKEKDELMNMKGGDYMEVIDLWEERSEIKTTVNTVAQWDPQER